jgi:RNA polymerase sigma-70 factor, ECF subfamily
LAAYIYGVGADVVYAAERFRSDGSQRALFGPPTERARFERMLDRHHRRLRRLVAGLIADRDRVDDVLQEAYLKAFRGLPRAFANDAHEATWLYRIVSRCCLDELRRRRRRRESPAAEVVVAAMSADAQPRLELEDAFRALAPDDRAVLLLVGVVGLDYETAAAILRVPRGTLAWRLSGARARFREVLS